MSEDTTRQAGRIEVTQGTSPLVLGLPHTGTEVPEEIAAGLNAAGRALADTDWHVQLLYDGLVADVTTVRTPIHRYVIDVNRDPAGGSLYPGQNTTELCPLTDFNGDPIHHPGMAPDADEVTRRLRLYHTPYHRTLAAELARVQARHGFAILYDCHSIRGRVPFLFDGCLPVFNIGTNRGASCAPEIRDLVTAICADAPGYDHVLDGRFRGGWTTRHYGSPADGIHAIQMELVQASYMAEAPPWRWQPERAESVRAPLRAILEALQRWRP